MTSNNGEGVKGELESQMERWMCVEERAKVGAIDVFADLRTLGALIPVSTAYKRKKDKIRPLDQPTNGEGTGGDPMFLERCEKQGALEGCHMQKGPFDVWITPKFSTLPQGSRLTEERIADLDIGAELWPREKELLMALLFNREAAITFDWQEKGRIHKEIEPPHVICIRPGHIPWQEHPMRIPRALKPVFNKLVTGMRTSGVLEPSKGPYRNPAVLIKKQKPGEYRLISSVIKQNTETIQDTGVPPNVEEFSQRFARQTISSLRDFFAGYEQVLLAIESRDITAIKTEQGLMRFTDRKSVV